MPEKPETPKVETPVDRVRRAYGSYSAAERALGRKSGTLSRLNSPQELGGSDGVIHMRLAARIVADAEASGLPLCWDDMRPTPAHLDALDARDAANDRKQGRAA